MKYLTELVMTFLVHSVEYVWGIAYAIDYQIEVLKAAF